MLPRLVTMAVRLTRIRISCLFVLVIASALFLFVYWVTSGHQSVDLHRVYAERQNQIRHSDYGVGEYKRLPNLATTKSWNEQPHVRKSIKEFSVWKPNRVSHILERTETDARLKMMNPQEAEKQMLTNVEPKLTKNIGSNNFNKKRQQLGANEHFNMNDYIEIDDIDIKQANLLRDESNKLHDVLQTKSARTFTQGFGHFVTDATKQSSQVKNLEGWTTAKPKWPLQSWKKNQLVSANKKVDQVILQLNLSDSKAHEHVHELSTIKVTLPYKSQQISHQAEYKQRKQIDYISRLRTQSQPPFAVQNLHLHHSVAAEKTKHESPYLVNQQDLPVGQNLRQKPLLPGINPMGAGGSRNHDSAAPFGKSITNIYKGNLQIVTSEPTKKKEVGISDPAHIQDYIEVGVFGSKQEHGNNPRKTLPNDDLHPLPLSDRQQQKSQQHEPYGVMRGDSLKHYLQQQQQTPRPLTEKGQNTSQNDIRGQVVSQNSGCILIHGGKTSHYSHNEHVALTGLPQDVPQAAYTFEATELPSEPRFRPSIGNGLLGTVIYNQHMFLSGFYNGYQGQSHRAEIPSTVSIRLAGTEPETKCHHKYILNVAEGIFSEICTNTSYTLELRIYAHRTVHSVMVVEVHLTRKMQFPIRVKLEVDKWHASSDITFKLQQLDDVKNVSLKAGHISAPETRDMPYAEMYILYDHVPTTLEPPSGSNKVKWVFLTVVGASKEEVTETYKNASALIHSGDKLYASHIKGWSDLWHSGYIDIGGNLTIAKATFSSMYQLLSSVPTQSHHLWPFVGLSASGLPLGDFTHPQDHQGLVSCDQELWMFPPLLTFHPDLSKLILKSRSRFIAKKAAAQLAERNGFLSSLQYPWQTGISGTELTSPDDARIHSLFTSGLISHTVLQYLHATNDTSLLRDDQFAEILTSVANYYYHKILKNNKKESNSYHLSGVLSMDSYAHLVNNSAFTNVIASIALSAPSKVFSFTGQTISLEYDNIAQRIYIPFDSEGNFHLEHSNYTRGHPISQADVVLLGYPLMREMTPEVRKNDLNIYEKVLNTKAPSMSWAVHSIGWFEVGDTRKALQAFNKQFAYLVSDFQVWTETGISLGGANFLSAAGSFLQSITNGFLGLRYHDDHLSINPVLPPGAEYMRFGDINYLGSSLNIWVSQSNMVIQVARSTRPGTQGLKLFIPDPVFVSILIPGHPIRVSRAKTHILPRNAPQPN